MAQGNCNKEETATAAPAEAETATAATPMPEGTEATTAPEEAEAATTTTTLTTADGGGGEGEDGVPEDKRDHSGNAADADPGTPGCICALLGTILGWTPDLYLKRNEILDNNKTPRAWFYFIFLLDLADAVVDFILLFHTFIGSDSDKTIGWGIFLFVGLVLGKIIVYIYGEAIKEFPKYKSSANEELVSFADLFYFKEQALFFVQDGAAVVFILNTESDGNGTPTYKKISIYLTICCSIVTFFYTCGMACRLRKSKLKDLLSEELQSILMTDTVSLPLFYVSCSYVGTVAILTIIAGYHERMIEFIDEEAPDPLFGLPQLPILEICYGITAFQALFSTVALFSASFYVMGIKTGRDLKTFICGKPSNAGTPAA